MNKFFIVIVPFLLLAVPPAMAINIPYTLTEQITVSSIDGTGGDPALTHQRIVTSGPSSFFAELGTTNMVTWETHAPNGGQFVVDPPRTGENLVIIDFGFQADPGIGGGPFDNVAIVNFEFLGLQGTPPLLIDADSFRSENGNRFSARVDLHASDPFSFTGFRLKVTDDFSGPLLNYVPSSSPPIARFFNFGGLNQPAADQFIFFIAAPVPEPATATMTMLAAGGLFLRRRRAA